ncbi:MAG: hypothetical protein DCF25_21070 [Leptolyngbya foveolarum]|uniref:Uncharacterized protein n=1 Tax=Leptolyngbya foveolarum TaxID=47253 RepID=A0A2W4TMF2_9CYAN|nr:MAG: hypothetical protein DCF25_21070 [Leptolyngbya foveolarum]
MNEQIKGRSNPGRSKSRRRVSKQSNLLKMIFGPLGLAIFMVGAIAVLAYRNRPEQIAFEPGTTEGKAALTAAETFPDDGRKHVEPGETVNYEKDFPTSGPHDPNPGVSGVYSQEQRLNSLYIL